MLVKTPAMKLGVEVREIKTEDGKLIMKGVATSMPCTVEIGGPELRYLALKILSPRIIFKVIGLMFKSKA